MNNLRDGNYRNHYRAFLVGTALVRKHFGDEVSIRELYVRFVMINILMDAPYTTVGELAEKSGVPLATVSRFMWTCLTEGKVREVIDPADRRRRLLTITEAGEDLCQGFADDWEAHMGGPIPSMEEFLKLNPPK